MNASSICLHLADLLLNRRAISYWQQSDSCLHDVATRYLVWQVSTSQGLFHRFYDPQQRMTKHLLLWLASTIVTQSMQGSRRRLLTSCNECSMLPPVWSMTRGSLIVAWRHSSTMSFIGLMCQRGLLTRWVHDVPLSSWSGTLLPCRPFHHVLRRRFSASFAFCKPSPADCTSLSSQHMAVGRFRSPVLWSGTRCLTSSEIQRVVLTVLSSFLRQTCSVFTNVTSTLEVFFLMLCAI